MNLVNVEWVSFIERDQDQKHDKAIKDSNCFNLGVSFSYVCLKKGAC